ncbi:MAG: Beta-hexosaminidase [Candidatus Marinimicrobia bacterium]|nr:Beta-hexosaminidase [Candidatus Neomarinimicrobiota bacterium]
MKRLYLFIIFSVACLFFGFPNAKAAPATKNLMPVPQSVEWMDGQFRITDDFTMGIAGDPADRIYPYATRVLRRLSGRTGLFFSQDKITPESDSVAVDFTVDVQQPGEVKLHMDESYQLLVTPDSLVLKANTDIGALRGLETFLQLVEADSRGYYLPAVTIEDNPRFAWRGLLIDACRHWMPVGMVKRNLDGMAAVKMNVLHWHLTEDQGFRVESKTFPKLHEKGSDGKYYTQEQIRDVIDYANDRGIRVVPEFDMPGHATSWLVGYPELASAPGPYSIERHWGIMDPVMNPAREYTYEFLDKFLTEMADLFPDEYIHIGGDENNGKHWNANEDIQQFMQENNIKDNHELQAYFNKRILKILARNSKKMMGWDEIFQPGIPKDIVIHSWRGKEALIEAAKKGYQTVLSNGYYIDLIQPTSFHYQNDPIPADSDLTPEERENILGGEATMWAELVTTDNVDSRIWPRTAAIAERLWSPREITDNLDMYRRLETTSWRLEELGLQHIRNQDMMLRRLTRGKDITALKNLVAICEPIKIYTRHQQGKEYTSYAPYTRTVDAARPDAKVAREFRWLVDEYLENLTRESALEIKLWLMQWKMNHGNLMETVETSPVLHEIVPLSKEIQSVATIGLEALESLERKTIRSQQWVDAQLAVIEQAKRPIAEMEIMIIPAVEQLVAAAGPK